MRLAVGLSSEGTGTPMKTTVYARILHTLNNEALRFSVYDFKVDTPDGKTVSIEYHHANYRISFHHQCGARNGADLVILLPGEFDDEERVDVYGVGGFLERIPQWLSNIREEIDATPFLLEVTKIRTQQADFEKRLEFVENTAFTREEAAELVERIEKLEAKLAAQLEESGNADMSAEARVLDDLREAAGRVSTSTKRGFMRWLYPRVEGWSKNPSIAKVLGAGMKALVSNVKDVTVDS